MTSITKTELEVARKELDKAFKDEVIELTVAYLDLQASIETEIEKKVYSKLYQIALKNLDKDYNDAIFVIGLLEGFVEKDEKENFYEIEPGYKNKLLN